MVDFVPIFRGDLEHASIEVEDELIYPSASGERAEFGDVVAVLFEPGDVFVLGVGDGFELLEDFHDDEVNAVADALLRELGNERESLLDVFLAECYFALLDVAVD